MPLTIQRSPRKGWLVLIGGGEFSFGETEEIDRFLLEKLPPHRRTIAFLPTGSGSTEYAIHLGEHFRRLDATVEVVNIPVYRLRDAKRAKNADRIRAAGMVYVGGGVTNEIISAIRGTVVEEAMRAVLEQDGVVAGIGAGACVFGAVTRSMMTVGAPIEGLGWVSGALVESGVRSPEDRRFTTLMGSPRVEIGIGIPERAALAIGPDGAGTVLGEGNVVVLRKKKV